MWNNLVLGGILPCKDGTDGNGPMRLKDDTQNAAGAVQLHPA